MDARGAAESESGSAFGDAPVGDDVDFRFPEDWKNLLKTACFAGAGPAAAARPEAGFRLDISGSRVTTLGQGRAGSATAAPHVCGREHVTTLPCAGAGGGVSAAQMGPRGRGGCDFAPNSVGISGVARSAVVFTPAAMVRPLNCIVAVSQNMGIGKNGDLPWPPLRYLRARKCFGCLGRGVLARVAFDRGTREGPDTLSGRVGSDLVPERTSARPLRPSAVWSRQALFLVCVLLLFPGEDFAPLRGAAEQSPGA